MSDIINDLGAEFNAEEFLKRSVKPPKKSNPSPVWKKATPNLFPESKLAKFRKTLKQAENAIDKVNSALETADSVVDLLAQLESAVTDPIQSLIQVVAGELDGVIENLASTGVYFLDSVTPYIIGNGFEIGNAGKKKIGSIDEETRRQLNSTIIDYNYSSTSGPYDKKSERWNDTAYKLLTYFRPITYDEWILEIAEAFIDPNDQPDGKITSSYFTQRNDVVKPNLGRTKSEIFNSFLSGVESGVGFVSQRPGAPQWGLGSRSSIYVVALALPDSTALVSIINNVFDFLDFFGSSSKSDLKSMPTDIVDAFKKEFEDFANTGSELSSALLNAVQTKQRNLSPISSGSGEDFYGLTLGSIFTKLFNYLRRLSASLKSFATQINSSLSGMLEGILDGLQTTIDTIKKLVGFVDDILTLLKTFAVLNVYVLKIESSGGVNDIYNQLLEATGFPDQEDQLNQIILGFTLAAGYADSSSNAFDFGKYIAQQKKTFDREKGDLKDQYKGDKSDGGLGGLNKFMGSF